MMMMVIGRLQWVRVLYFMLEKLKVELLQMVMIGLLDLMVVVVVEFILIFMMFQVLVLICLCGRYWLIIIWVLLRVLVFLFIRMVLGWFFSMLWMVLSELWQFMIGVVVDSLLVSLVWVLECFLVIVDSYLVGVLKFFSLVCRVLMQDLMLLISGVVIGMLLLILLVWMLICMNFFGLEF